MAKWCGWSATADRKRPDWSTLVGPTSVRQSASVPLIDVTYDERIDDQQLRRLADVLADVVPVAVECPEEPLVGPPGPGDLEIRFHRKCVHDVGDLSVTVEVRTKRFESRTHDAQHRADMIQRRLATLGLGPVGVWLVLLDGAWSQG